MKKKIAACMVLLAVLFAHVYSLPYLPYYRGDGYAAAQYYGTTKNLTIDEVHNDRWWSTYYGSDCSKPQSFSGKLSKRQSRLLWDALSQYDYAPGEIYMVFFAEENMPTFYFLLSVLIEADGSVTWKGFTYSLRD